MEDLSLHILDIAENSTAAGADSVTIRVREDSNHDLLTLEIMDNGAGMDEEKIPMVTDPFFTTKSVRRVGLGLPLLRQAAEECDGTFAIDSEKGKGTTITASFRNSHIDRKPLGDIPATLMVLIAGNPSVDFILEYARGGHVFRFDTREIKQELGEVPIHAPGVLKVIKEEIERGIRELKP